MTSTRKTAAQVRQDLAADDTLTPAEFGRLVEEDADARERASWDAEREDRDEGDR